MTINGEVLVEYRRLRMNALAPQRRKVSGAHLTWEWSAEVPNGRALKRHGLSKWGAQKMLDNKRFSLGYSGYGAMTAKDALQAARQIAQVRALGFDADKMYWHGGQIDETNVGWRLDVPMKNGHTLAVLTTPDVYYDYEIEGEYTNRLGDIYERTRLWNHYAADYARVKPEDRPARVTTPRKVQDRRVGILTQEEADYRERNEGAESGGTGNWRSRWGMYYIAPEDNDAASWALYRNKRGMSKGDAWLDGLCHEKNIERSDGDTQRDIVTVILMEMDENDTPVLLWESWCGVVLSGRSNTEDTRRIVETATDMLSNELRDLLGAPESAPVTTK